MVDIRGFTLFVICISEVEKLECNYSAKLTCLWLFNPLTLAICTRGSAEPIMSFLLITLIYFIAKDQAFLGGVIYALAILFKIYPVIYSLPIFLYFQKSRVGIVCIFCLCFHKLQYFTFGSNFQN